MKVSEKSWKEGSRSARHEERGSRSVGSPARHCEGWRVGVMVREKSGRVIVGVRISP